MTNIDTSTKIFISTHKDFKLISSDPVYTIISGKGDLKDNYNIKRIEEDWEGKYIVMHDSYAELTRLFYIYKKFIRLPQYVGFCQYKRMFNFPNDKPIDVVVSEIMKDHDAILPNHVLQYPNVKKAYGMYHRQQDIDAAEEIIKKKFPHFVPAMEEAFNKKELFAHNMFIMKQKDFRDYCYFLMTIFNELDRRNGWTDMDTEHVSGVKQNKTHGFLAERLSNVFYMQRFKKIKEMPFVTVR